MLGQCNRARIIAEILYWQNEGDEPRRRKDAAKGVETRVRFYDWHKGQWVQDRCRWVQHR